MDTNLETLKQDFINTLAKENITTYADRIETVSFAQVWGNTGIGLQCCGCDALTATHTVVLHDTTSNWYCVYFDNVMAYKIKNPNSRFFEDMQAHNMLPRHKATKYMEEISSTTHHL